MNQAAEMVNEVEVKESSKSTFMKRVWAKMGKDEKGFTLIELLAVLIIVAIIAVIAIPLIGGVINNSRTKADLSTATQLYEASRLYVVGENNGNFKTVTASGGTAGVVTLAMLNTGGYIESGIVRPSTKVALTTGTVVTYDTTTGALTSVTLADGGTPRTYPASEILSGGGA